MTDAGNRPGHNAPRHPGAAGRIGGSTARSTIDVPALNKQLLGKWSAATLHSRNPTC